MLVKGGLIFLAPTGVGISRAQASGAGFIVAKAPHWSKKAVIMKNVPYTNVSPTKGQADTRVHFGELARKHKGEKGFGPDGLPIIAHDVKTEMAGFKSRYSMAKEAYPSKHKHTFHTMDDLKKMLE